MKVLRDGKVVKGAVVRYDASGNPEKVVDPSKGNEWHPATEFEFKEETPKKKTRKGRKKKTK